ncbi:MAG: DNA mismatch repair protein MutS [Rhodocyclaceae bacterium]|nr:MAG: DNA mismatch repair protein MutS [Rhodocyclaceae bacterium]
MSKRREPPVDAEDRALFRAAATGVVPLVTDRVLHESVPPPPIPRQRALDEQAALDESLNGPPLLDLHLEGGDEAAWLRPGLARSVLRDLRRGRWVTQDALDLHGCNREEARLLVVDFMTGAIARGLRCLRIVHGKGLGSPGREPVLKKLVHGWLAQRNEVLAFCQARAAEGGAGAVVVLLKSPGK